MGENLARKLIADHLVDGDMEPGGEIALRVNQILTHDGTGPLCALELEAMGSTGPCAQTAVAYVVQPRQCRGGARSRGIADLPVLHWILGQPRLSRHRRGR